MVIVITIVVVVVVMVAVAVRMVLVVAIAAETVMIEVETEVLQGHVNLVTVLSHLGVDILELGRGGGNETLDLVGSPCAGSLVLGLELLGELVAGLLGGLTEVGNLVVPRGHSVLE